MQAGRKTRACLLAIAIALGSGAALAQQPPSETQILEALKHKANTRGLTRSLSGGAGQVSEERRFIDNLRSKTTRAITVEERAKVAEIAKDQPNIDLEITFDYDSANINARALPTLVNLGRALSNPDLKGTVFLVGGHTDASGGDAYNQNLSERRAESVKRFLIEKFRLDAENLVAVGFGKEQLKIKSQPFADANRRVQVVNMAR
jgi:outer membrane protein OmpA-like peptidoglycan-associated protein